MYLRQAEGHRVPILVKGSPTHTSEGKIVGGVKIFSDDSQYEVHHQRLQTLRELAYTDYLTGLANRRPGAITPRSRVHK